MSTGPHKFRAPTLDEAYRQMRRELGPDAVVLRTAQVRERGFLGLLGRTVVEIAASAPPGNAARSSGAGRGRGPNPYAANRYAHSGAGGRIAYFEKLVSDAQQRMYHRGSDEPVQDAPSPPSGSNAFSAYIGEHTSVSRGPDPSAQGGVSAPPYIADHGSLASKLEYHQQPNAGEASETERLRKEMQEVREMVQVLLAEKPDTGLPAEFASHYRALVEAGVVRKAAAQLIAEAAATGDVDVLRDEQVFRERLRFVIRKTVRVSGGLAVGGQGRQVVALVGPTGVGKTTNVAKLAAQYAVRQRARVGLITADTYRVAAPEQLRVYANIIGLSLRVVNDAREMAAALKAFSGYDLVLMDTAGGSQYNQKQIQELKLVLAAAQPNETILVLNANTQLEDQRSILAGFKHLRPSSLVFSKLDETRRFGGIYSIMRESGLPLSYFSTGQNVPDDIVKAHPGMVAKLIVEGRENRGRSSTTSA